MDTRLNTDKRCDMPAKPDGQNEDTTCNKAFVRRKRKIALVIDCSIAIFVLLIILLIELDVIPHRHIGFYCKDPKLSFPNEGETVTTAALLFSVYIGPLIIIGLVESKGTKRSLKESLRRTWFWYREYLLGISALLALIQCTKVMIAEHRPHFFETCRPNVAQNCTADKYISEYKCTNKKDKSWIIADASRSFPSGHTAASIFAAFFCSWYLERRLIEPVVRLGHTAAFIFAAFFCSCYLERRLIEPVVRLGKPLTQLCLLLASTFCSLSRISDNRHHWWDVAAGLMFGLVFWLYVSLVLCHTAASIFAASFCSWYLERRLIEPVVRLGKPLAQLCLLLASTFCSLSRISDNRHHWWDVAAGLMFGLVFWLYVSLVLCKDFSHCPRPQGPPRPSHSTVTLLTDTTNKNAASVVL